MVIWEFGLLGTGELGDGKPFAPDSDPSLTPEVHMGHGQKPKANPTFPLQAGAHPAEKEALPPHKRHPAEKVTAVAK